MKLKENYSPMYFAASLGAGGLAVSFYMYLMFLIPHKGVPLATFDFIYPALLKGNAVSLISGFALVFIIVFAFLHFKLLIWNVKSYNIFKHTKPYHEMVISNKKVLKMLLPLTFAMTINVCFVLGATFVPNLWSVIEYLFPLALLGFAVVGYFALVMFSDYCLRLMQKGNFDFENNNNFSQVLSSFAFTMIGVGFAAPGAMSHILVINAIGIFGAILFSSLSIFILITKMIFGFKSILRYGLNIEATPTIWLIIPILTLLGITMVRVMFGIGHHFDHEMNFSSLFILTSFVVSIQILFGALGYKIMKAYNYFNIYIYGTKKVPESLTLICPGVAFMVFGIFFINFGLVSNHIIDKYSIAYYLSYLPFVYVQYKTVVIYFILKKKLSI